VSWLAASLPDGRIVPKGTVVRVRLLDLWKFLIPTAH
jgi:hypothetical protein